MLSIEDRGFCQDIAQRVRTGAFFNAKDALQMLKIIKRLEESGEELKRQFGKMAIDLEETYRKRLEAMH